MNPTLPSTFQMLLSLYGYLLPLVLYVVWSTLALWDLGHRDELSSGALWLWTLAIFLLPFAGALAYLLVGGARIGPRTRLTCIGGGAVLYALVLIIGAGIGGIS